MTFSSRAVQAAILKKGFRVSQGDHRWYILYVEDRKHRIKTFVSHGSTHSIDSYLQGRMSRQMHLTRSEFNHFVECPLTAGQYAGLMRERGQIS